MLNVRHVEIRPHFGPWQQLTTMQIIVLIVAHPWKEKKTMVQIDISLPHSCDDCPFGYEDYKTNVPGCDLMEDLPNCPEYDWNTPMGQRDKNCPLREALEKEDTT